MLSLASKQCDVKSCWSRITSCSSYKFFMSTIGFFKDTRLGVMSRRKWDYQTTGWTAPTWVWGLEEDGWGWGSRGYIIGPESNTPTDM